LLDSAIVIHTDSTNVTRGGETMSDFPIHTIDSAPSGSRPLLEKLAAEVGFVPNLAASMAESPTTL
jgi:hypothetical protein